MASAAKALRLGLRRCSAATVTTTTTTTATKTTTAVAMMSTSTRGTARGAAQVMKRTQLATAATQIRHLSSSAPRNADEPSDNGNESVPGEAANVAEAAEAAEPEAKRGPKNKRSEWTPEDQKILESIQSGQKKYVSLSAASPAKQKQLKQILERMDTELDIRSPTVSKDTLTDFWSNGVRAEDLQLNEKEDIYEDNDMTTIAHAKLDDIRERRHYMRLIAWEMPLLAKMAKPFEPPTPEMPLRFRYTSYMGEYHPAEKKVVVEFCPADLGLTPVQQDKLKKLAGARYNPEKEIVRMSCESHEHQAQNKRYLGDLVQKLIAEAKDPKDTFEDIPLDTRHHKFKPKPKFPKEWRMSDERKKELQAIRAESFKLDQQRAAAGKLVDGARCIQQALAGPAEQPGVDPVAELLRLSPQSTPAPLQG